MLICACAASEEDYIVAQPGDSGADVEIVLQKCAELGFIQDLPKGADEYLEEYGERIMKLERTLGFTEDGIIHLSELEELETAIGAGSSGSQVKDFLELLFDLGYIRDVLPEPHTVFEQKYVSAVKAAEKKLGTHTDGILTESEQQLLKKEKVPSPGEITQISARYSNGKVIVSWNTARGAVSYSVIRDGVTVYKATGKTSWEDTNVSMGEYHSYTVRPSSYNHIGHTSKRAEIEIPITYKSVNLKDLSSSGKKYLSGDTRFVQFNSMSYQSCTIKGKDIEIRISQKISGKIYYAVLILEDYKNWTGDVPSIMSKRNDIKTVSGQGYVKSGGITPEIVLNQISYNW